VDDVRQWLLGQKAKPKTDDIDPKKLQDLMQKLNQNKDNVDPKQIEQLLKDNPQFQNKEFLDQLKKLVDDPNFPQNLENKLPKEDGVPPIENKEDLEKKLNEVIKSGNEQIDPNLLPKEDPKLPKVDPNNPDMPKDPKLDPGTDPAFDNEWVKWLDKNFGDSPATQDALKDLANSLKGENGKGLFDDIPELKNGGWKELENWGKANSGELSNFKPPKMEGNTGGGSTNFGGGGGGGGSHFGSGGGSSNSFGGPGGGTGLGSGGVSSLAIIAATVGALILAVLLFRKWKVHQSERAIQAHARHGIDFEAIRSREELVRAFDTVSLDQHGDDARNWNHRVIADQFRTQQPTNADAAEEVAGLYERARYAPVEEDLTAGDFASARRDLRVIAGATA
jgi:hypothetical protein